MINPDQAFKLSGVRNAVALSRRFMDGEQENLALRYAQVGLPFVSEHSAYLTVHLKPEEKLSLADFKKLVQYLHYKAQDDDFKWVVVVSVSFERWIRWSKENSLPLEESLLGIHQN